MTKIKSAADLAAYMKSHGLECTGVEDTKLGLRPSFTYSTPPPRPPEIGAIKRGLAMYGGELAILIQRWENERR